MITLAVAAGTPSASGAWLSVADERIPGQRAVGDAPHFLVMLSAPASDVGVPPAPSAHVGGATDADLTGDSLVSDAA